MFYKRGVSAVIATVLIIMITVSAVAILWAFIIPLIKDSLGDSVSEKVYLNIETFKGYTVYDADTQFASVQIGRGQDEVELGGIQVIFTFSDGTSKEFEINESNYGILEKGAMAVYNFEMLEDPSEISVAPIILLDGGNKKLKDSTDKKEAIESPMISIPITYLDWNGSFINIMSCDTSWNCENRDCMDKSCVNNFCVYSPKAPQCFGVLCVGVDACGNSCEGESNCAECLNDTHCSEGVCYTFYNAYTCVECLEDTDCSEEVCNLADKTCVECLDNSDCSTGSICSSNQCFVVDVDSVYYSTGTNSQGLEGVEWYDSGEDSNGQNVYHEASAAYAYWYNGSNWLISEKIAVDGSPSNYYLRKSYPQTINVRNAGTETVNGEYNYFITLDSRPRYSKSTGGYSLNIYYNTGEESWIISVYTVSYYKYLPAYGLKPLLPPTSAQYYWTAFSGENPTPILSYSSYNLDSHGDWTGTINMANI